MSEEKKSDWKFYLLVPLMMQEAIDKIIAVLVKRGYTVGPLSSDKRCYTTADLSMSTILQLEIEKRFTEKEAENREKARSLVLDDVKDVLKVTKTKYYMIWLGDPGAMCTWAIGNIKRDPAQEAVNVGPYRTPGNAESN